MTSPSATLDIDDVIQIITDAQRRDLHTCMPGQVVTYYPATQTADIQPLVRAPRADGSGYEDHPILPHVPVRWFSCGPFVIVGFLHAGDVVDVHFTSADASGWRSSGQVSDPLDTRMHAMSSAFCTPGARAAADTLHAPTTDELVIGVDNDDQQVVIDASFVRMGRGATDFVALATLVNAQLTAIKTATDAAIAAAGPGAANFTAFKTSLTPAWPADVSATVAKAK